MVSEAISSLIVFLLAFFSLTFSCNDIFIPIIVYSKETKTLNNRIDLSST